LINLQVSIGCLLAIEGGDFEMLDRLLAEDMLFCGPQVFGPMPQPMSKKQFVNLMKAIRSGIPNWRSHFHEVASNGPFVSMTIQVSGAHLCHLPGLLPGMPDHPPSGVSFHLPPERIEFTIIDGKITRIHLEPVPGGGIIGMLEQLGILVPSIN
jgi:hypothetical protein